MLFQRLDKRTGEFLSQPVKQDFMELSVGFSDGNVIGMENDWDGECLSVRDIFIKTEFVCRSLMP